MTISKGEGSHDSAAPRFVARPFSRTGLVARHLLAMLFLPMLCLSIAGCGQPTVGHVTGNVLYEGEPLPSGTVVFMGAGGWTRSSNIREGSYEIDEIPPGEVRITVQTFPPSPGVVPPDTPASSVKLPSLKYQQIPARYADFGTSGLSYNVRPGSQSHDIPLIPLSGKAP